MVTFEITEEIMKKIKEVIQTSLEFEKLTSYERGICDVGEIGEILTCYHMEYRLVARKVNKGFDAVDSDGKRVQIKTRRRVGDATRYLGSFSNDEFDYACMTLLDESYEVIEIWRASQEDIMKKVAEIKEKSKHGKMYINEFKNLVSAKQLYPILT